MRLNKFVTFISAVKAYTIHKRYTIHDKSKHNKVLLIYFDSDSLEPCYDYVRNYMNCAQIKRYWNIKEIIIILLILFHEQRDLIIQIKYNVNKVVLLFLNLIKIHKYI